MTAPIQRRRPGRTKNHVAPQLAEFGAVVAHASSPVTSALPCQLLQNRLALAKPPSVAAFSEGPLAVSGIDRAAGVAAGKAAHFQPSLAASPRTIPLSRPHQRPSPSMDSALQRRGWCPRACCPAHQAARAVASASYVVFVEGGPYERSRFLSRRPVRRVSLSIVAFLVRWERQRLQMLPARHHSVDLLPMKQSHLK